MKTRKFLLSFLLALFLMTSSAFAEEVLDMSLVIDDGKVSGNIILIDDESSSYSGSSGDYELKILDSKGNVLWNQNFELSYMYNETLTDLPFDILGYKIPYDSSVSELKLYKNSNNIFSKQLSFCNNNGVCDYDSESDYSCPEDCAPASSRALSIASPASSTDGVVTFDKTLSKDPSIYFIESVEHDGNYLWAAEPSYKSGVKVFKVDDDTGSVVDSYLQRHYTVGVSNVIGLAYDHVHNYIFNHVFPYGPIYAVDANPPYSEIRSFSAPASWIHDIAFDGTYLWAVRGSSPFYVYKMNANTGSVVAQFAAPVAAGNPGGITFDGQYLWINRGGYLFQIDQNKAIADGHCENAILHKYSTSVGGRLAWDGTRLWTQDSTHFYRLKLPTPTPKLKILFVPLGNWAGNQTGFNDLVEQQMAAFVEDLPLKECYDNRVVRTKLDVNKYSFSDFTCSKYGIINEFKITTFLISKGINYGDYDYIIGIGLFGKDSPCDGAGWHTNIGHLAWVDAEYEYMLAHELGHFFGLSDEYCSNPAGSKDPRCNDAHQQWNIGPQFFSPTDINYLDPDSPFYCDAREGGNCCEFGEIKVGATKYFFPDCDPSLWRPFSPLGYHICCRGNYNLNGGIATMSFSNAHEIWSGKRGFDKHSLDHLVTFPELKCD